MNEISEVDSLKVLSLCSGIGGFEIAAAMVNDRLGREVFQLKALCEKNKFCRDRALKFNFPNIPIYEDIRDIAAQFGDYDLIVGGLPCQPFSQAGKKKGEADDRNLFPEFFRILCSVRPRGAIIENVPGLLTANAGRFFRDILWQFTQAGYSVAWDVVSCAEMGGTHLRERLWIVAYSNSVGQQSPQAWAVQNYPKRNLQIFGQGRQPKLHEVVSSSSIVANSNRERRQESNSASIAGESRLDCGRVDADTDKSRCEQQLQEANQGWTESRIRSGVRQKEEVKPGFRSSNDGLPSGLVRSHLMTPADLPEWLPYATDSEDVPYRKEMLEALGNAIVPDVAAIALWRFLELINLIEA